MAAPSTTWRGWNADAADGAAVVSGHLGRAVVANRLFPKVRSWFALGAPLELLSPLSVVRVVALLAVVTWPGAALVGAIAPAAAVLGTVAALGACGWLMSRSTLSPAVTRQMTFGLTAMVAASIAVSGADASIVPFAVVLVASAITVAMFAAWRTVVVHQAFAAVASTGAVAVAGVDRGPVAALSIALATTIGALTVHVTTRSSRFGATIDPDTGVCNSHGAAELLDTLCGRGFVQVGVLHLQGVEEARSALGHHVASELVRRTVEDLGQVVPATTRLGRITDDDLVFLTPLADDPDVRRDQADEVLDAVAMAIGRGRFVIGAIEITLDLHIGTTIAEPGGTADGIELIRRAQAAADVATSRGIAHSTWDGSTTTLTAADLDLLTDLRYAVERGELWLAYQPKFTPGRSRPASVEALLRWTSARHGEVSPATFIPLAERTGLIDRLTDWVLAEALLALRRWLDAGIELNVAVNVSPQSLRTVDFTERVTTALAASRVPPSAVTLEVTESVAFDVVQAVERLVPLRRLGVRVSIDDFGTGYTSLAVLPHLPLDEIKVDQQFVREMVASPASDAIVRSVCELAHRLGLTAVAEGVENTDLAHRLTECGYDVLQGFLYSRPLTEGALIQLLAEHPVSDREPARHR